MSLFNMNNRAGMTAVVDATTSEVTFAGLWGEMNARTAMGVIVSTAVEATFAGVNGSAVAANSPVTTLRAGIVLGKNLTTGKLIQTTGQTYAAVGICGAPVNMLVGTTATDRDVVYLTGGQVRASLMYNLTYLSAIQLYNRGFFFDDDRLNFNGSTPRAQVVAAADPTAAVLTTGTQNGFLFLCTSGGAMDFTLPDPVAAIMGLSFFVTEVIASTAVTLKTASNGATSFVTAAGADAQTAAVVGVTRIECIYTSVSYRWAITNL
jgi:hypothetical protein